MCHSVHENHVGEWPLSTTTLITSKQDTSKVYVGHEDHVGAWLPSTTTPYKQAGHQESVYGGRGADRGPDSSRGWGPLERRFLDAAGTHELILIEEHCCFVALVVRVVDVLGLD